jgi:hypothetical protein
MADTEAFSRVKQFSLKASDVVATKKEVGWWRFGFITALAVAVIFALVGIRYEMERWTEAAKRADEYRQIQVELQRRQVSLSDRRADATQASVDVALTEQHRPHDGARDRDAELTAAHQRCVGGACPRTGDRLTPETPLILPIVFRS